jgi:hypothetical protein
MFQSIPGCHNHNVEGRIIPYEICGLYRDPGAISMEILHSNILSTISQKSHSSLQQLWVTLLLDMCKPFQIQNTQVLEKQLIKKFKFILYTIFELMPTSHLQWPSSIMSVNLMFLLPTNVRA